MAAIELAVGTLMKDFRGRDETHKQRCMYGARGQVHVSIKDVVCCVVNNGFSFVDPDVNQTIKSPF